MINEQMTLTMQAQAARIKVLEDFLKGKFPNEFPMLGTGASGSMTPVDFPILENGKNWVISNAPSGVNARARPNIGAEKLNTFPYQASLQVLSRKPDMEGQINNATGHPYIWYETRLGYVREDVVTFSFDKPTPPLNAAIWPAPVQGAKITNTHANERDHDGLDYACPLGTPIRVGPNGGYVAKAFVCTFCNAVMGDGAANLQDPGKGYGYGSFVIVRYAYDILPPTVKAVISNGAYLYAIHAHLSKVLVQSGQTLEPYQVIGEVGASGNTYSINGGSPAHLHFALRWSTHPEAEWKNMDNNRVNPNLLVKG